MQKEAGTLVDIPQEAKQATGWDQSKEASKKAVAKFHQQSCKRTSTTTRLAS